MIESISRNNLSIKLVCSDRSQTVGDHWPTSCNIFVQKKDSFSKIFLYTGNQIDKKTFRKLAFRTFFAEKNYADIFAPKRQAT